jgi:acyl carrier protein
MLSSSASREEEHKSMLETIDANLREDLRALVAEIAEKEQIPDGATFKELGIDSMMGVEIVAAVERHYQIKIEDEELAGFTDLEAAYCLVVKKLAGKRGASAAE